MYTVVTTPSARKSIRKLPKQVQKHLKKEILTLADHPYKGKPLKKKFRFLHVLRIVFRRTHYRVAYEVDYPRQEVTVRYAATRENFYKEVARKRLSAAA